MMLPQKPAKVNIAMDPPLSRDQRDINCRFNSQRKVPKTDMMKAQSGPARPEIAEKAIILAREHFKACTAVKPQVFTILLLLSVRYTENLFCQVRPLLKLPIPMKCQKGLAKKYSWKLTATISRLKPNVDQSLFLAILKCSPNPI